MTSEFSYVIERYGVGGATEELLERAELIRAGEGLVCRVAGEERLLDATEVPAAIGSDPLLCEVRADQVTRITATGAAYAELPLLLVVPGDPDDFDENAWSDTLAQEHTCEEWVVQPGRLRALYVNGDRWGCWRTLDGPRALPQDWPMVGLSTIWGELDFSELMSMTSGLDQATIGLATPGAVATCFLADENLGNPDQQAAVWKRGDAHADAQMFVTWLLDWFPAGWHIRDENFSAMMAQLFIESTQHGRNGISTSGGMLVAGSENTLDFGDSDSSEWRLLVNLPPETINHALEGIARRGPRFADIGIAAHGGGAHCRVAGPGLCRLLAPPLVIGERGHIDDDIEVAETSWCGADPSSFRLRDVDEESVVPRELGWAATLNAVRWWLLLVNSANNRPLRRRHIGTPPLRGAPMSTGTPTIAAATDFVDILGRVHDTTNAGQRAFRRASQCPPPAAGGLGGIRPAVAGLDLAVHGDYSFPRKLKGPPTSAGRRATDTKCRNALSDPPCG